MTTHTTAATSWGADALQPIPATRRQKQEAMTRAEDARLAALDVRVRGWSDVHSLDDLEAMAEVLCLYKAEGYTATRIHLPDLARRLKTDDADASARLERLVKSGAVQRIRKVGQDPTFRTKGRDPVIVTKQERDIAEVRDRAEDALRASKGQEPVQRASPATSSFAPGTMLGLRRWN